MTPFDEHSERISALAEDFCEPDRGEIEDDRLRLIFTCCHPALSSDAQVALTLREVCGLTTEEIAAAFLASAADPGPAHRPRQGQDPRCPHPL